MAGEGRRTWYLRQVDLFQGLSDREIEQVASALKTRHYAKGALIVGQETAPEQIYVVMEGTVRLFHRGPDGREITADLLGPGRLFGVSRLFGAAESGLLAEAATDVVVCVGEGRQFLRVVAQWPRVMLALLQQIGQQLVRTEQHLEGVAAVPARARLAAALDRLARDAGERLPDGGYLLPRLPHPALAAQIGASRETVSRLLGELEAADLIRRERRRIIVPDLGRLRRRFDLPGEPP